MTKFTLTSLCLSAVLLLLSLCIFLQPLWGNRSGVQTCVRPRVDLPLTGLSLCKREGGSLKEGRLTAPETVPTLYIPRRSSKGSFHVLSKKPSPSVARAGQRGMVAPPRSSVRRNVPAPPASSFAAHKNLICCGCTCIFKGSVWPVRRPENWFLPDAPSGLQDSYFPRSAELKFAIWICIQKSNNQDTHLRRPCSSVPPAPFQALAFYAWTRSCSLRRLPSVASTWVERMLKGGLTDNCAPSTRGFLGSSSRRKGIFHRKFMAAPPRPVGKALAQNCTFLAPS